MTPLIETHIRPHRSWLRVDWRDLWEYRDLLVLLIRRDFTAKYRQTILGPAWFIIQPLMVSVVFTIVFGKVAQIPTDGLPPFLFFLCGQLAWLYFAKTLEATSNTFTTHADLFGKVYFPRLVVPASVAVSNVFALILQAATFFGFWCFYRFGTAAGASLTLSATWLLVPLLVVQTAILAVGVGLWFSAGTAKYKDLSHAFALITQLWLFATPIIYPISAVPAPWQWLPQLNPMSFVAESYRWILLGQGTVTWFGALWSLGLTVAVFLSGLMIFHRVERTFIDTV